MSEKKAAASPKKTLIIIAAVVLGVAILAGAAVFVWYNYIRDTGEYERYQFDTEAMEGRINQMTEEEVQAELNRVIEEGMFNISIASAVVFDPKTKEGEARIENIAANRYYMQVDIYLNDTGEKVYASKLIKPGYSVEKIKLDVDLSPGQYDATAIFSAITQDEMQLYGTAGAEIKLYIPDQSGRIPTATPTVEPTVTPEATVTPAT